MKHLFLIGLVLDFWSTEITNCLVSFSLLERQKGSAREKSGISGNIDSKKNRKNMSNEYGGMLT